MNPGNFKRNNHMVKKLESEPTMNFEREPVKKVVPSIEKIAE